MIFVKKIICRHSMIERKYLDLETNRRVRQIQEQKHMKRGMVTNRNRKISNKHKDVSSKKMINHVNPVKDILLIILSIVLAMTSGLWICK